jgi:hypothetical protein
MHPDISEFSFGFAFTNELITHYPITVTGAPRFPTQNEEGKKGGYDVKIPRLGAPFFLQFKRTEKMVRASAWPAKLVGTPHYRMHVRPRRHSKQHQLLLDLEDTGQEVYYTAPRFYQYEELNEYYLEKTIAENTSLISPSEIGVLPDDKDHYVAISEDDSKRRFCSEEPRPMPSVRSDVVLRERIVGRARERRQRIDETFFLDLGDQLLETFAERVPGGRPRERERAEMVRRQRAPDDYARELAQMLYGCELLIAEAPI